MAVLDGFKRNGDIHWTSAEGDPQVVSVSGSGSPLFLPVEELVVGQQYELVIRHDVSDDTFDESEPIMFVFTGE
jgi:hypothetical protein